ncbi:MAG: hypothetical protein EZS28_023775 [Streblomastix strix]|uniref:Uncharacterized protein n=1 Tax=Streblomastix strix TaxID=222440 RepID=A0A5J4VDR6_9EUKA|nr:MAG: hypothetical protein EZS28_023775 [Streblomastix strix]
MTTQLDNILTFYTDYSLTDRKFTKQKTADPDYGEIVIYNRGGFNVQKGSLLFESIQFMIQGELADQYVITMAMEANQLQLIDTSVNMRSIFNVVLRGLIEMVIGELRIDNMVANECIQKDSLIRINETAGKVIIDRSSFSNVEKTNGNGSVLYVYIKQQSGGITITDTKFNGCKVQQDQFGGAVYCKIFSDAKTILDISDDTKPVVFTKCQVKKRQIFPSGTGGGIYIELEKGVETFYDLTGCQYDGCDAMNGKSLFINAYDLRQAVPFVPTSDHLLKLGISLSGLIESVDVQNMMGYDNETGIFPIPLCYVYTQVTGENTTAGTYPFAYPMYHVNRTDDPFTLTSGHDNIACGHLKWPCRTVSYAILQSERHYPNAITPPGDPLLRWIGVIDKYKADKIYTLQSEFAHVTLQNQLDDQNKTTELPSEITVEEGGGFHINNATVRFIFLNFKIDMFGDRNVFIIEDRIKSVEFLDCGISMINESGTLLRSVLELNEGNLTIERMTMSQIRVENGFVFIIRGGAGFVDISESTFDTVERTMNGNGGVIEAYLNDKDFAGIKISNCEFTNCKVDTDQVGGALYLELSNKTQCEIEDSSFNFCAGTYGGAIYATVKEDSKLLIHGQQVPPADPTSYTTFFDCQSRWGNGGAIFVLVSDNSSFRTDQTQFSNNSAIETTLVIPPPKPTGFGGAVFLATETDYNDTNLGIDLSGAEFWNNTADRAGPTLYVVSPKLNELCLLDFENDKGHYLKGNYTEAQTIDKLFNETELSGVNLTLAQFDSYTKKEVIYHQQYLRRLWTPPILAITPDPALPYATDLLWYIRYRDKGAYPNEQGRDIYGCGWVDDPCKSMQFSLHEISYRIMGAKDKSVADKIIMIQKEGYDLMSPVNMSQEEIHTDHVWIMKEFYGTDLAIQDQIEIVIKKKGDLTVEDNYNGWLDATNGTRLDLTGFNITTDGSSLLIPIVYVGDTSSELKLEQIIFQEIELSPEFEQGARGVVHVNQNATQLIISQCRFQNINITRAGGSALRIQNITTRLDLSSIMGNQGPAPTSDIKASIFLTEFENITGYGDSEGRGGAGIYAEIGDRGYLSVIGPTKFSFCRSINGNGGGLYVILNQTGSFYTEGDVNIKDCEAVSDITNTYGGRGGGLYMYPNDDSNINFTISEETLFRDNNASLYGRDIFIYCRNINFLKTQEHVLYDVFSPLYNNVNAIYGTEYKDKFELWHIPLVDYDLLVRFVPYFSDIIYVSCRKWVGVDTFACGRYEDPCETFEYALTRILTPDWNISTRPDEDDEDFTPINYTIVSVAEMEINQTYTTEANYFTLRGISLDEVPEVAIYPSEVRFGGDQTSQYGQLLFAEETYWQQISIEGSDEEKVLGFNQTITFQYVNLSLPGTSTVEESVLKLQASKKDKKLLRTLNVSIGNCMISQNNYAPPYDTVYNFLKVEPYFTLGMNLTIINLEAFNISMIGNPLIQIKFIPELFTLQQHVYMEHCSFFNITTNITSSQLQEPEVLKCYIQIPTAYSQCSANTNRMFFIAFYIRKA